MRRLVLVLLAIPLAVVSAACGATNPPALEVDGAEVSQDDFRDALEVLGVAGAGDGTIAIAPDPETGGRGAAAVADQLIDVALIRDELEQRDAEPTDEDREFADSQLPEDTPDITEEARDQLLEWGAERIALLRAIYEDEVDTELLLCLRVILVADEAAAEEVMNELFTGADFGQVSRERSTDPALAQSGGELGCQADTFRPELQEAAAGLAVDDIGDPVTLEFGTVIPQRVAPSFETTAVAINDTILNRLLQERRADAEVDIDPRYGEWDEDAVPPQVAPPEGPVAPTTTAAPAAEVPFGQPPTPQTAPPPGG